MPEDQAPRTLTSGEWLSAFEERYLSDYVPSGGSVVRFISGEPQTLTEAVDGLQRVAAERNYHYRLLDAGARQPTGKPPSYHLIDRFYGAVTDGVDWQGWAREQARSVLDRLGVRVPEGCDLGDIQKLAAANGMDRDYLIQQYHRETQRAVQDRDMTVEFRSAVTNLWGDQLQPDTSTPGRGEVLTTWLSGRAAPPGGARVLRNCQIYGRINATNARHYLVSFCEWARRTGRLGILVVLDFRAYEWVGGTGPRSEQILREIEAAIARGAGTDSILAMMTASRADAPDVKYSSKAYVQMLSLLRRFIDEIDRFRGLALIVLTSPTYYAPSALKERRYTDYAALQTRIGEEVSDRQRPNPDAALIHLRENAQ